MGNNFGYRKDGSQKGRGFFGELYRPDGNVSTELSIGVEFDGKETEIPSLVPTLTEDEKTYLLAGGEATKEIAGKSAAHARERINKGLSPFATEEDLVKNDKSNNYSNVYLKHRLDAEKENGPLADFLRQNSQLFLKPKEVPGKLAQQSDGTEAEPEGEPTKTEKPSKLKTVLDTASFLLRPLTTLQAAAIAPIAHEFKEETILGQIGESFKASGKAAANALFPTFGEDQAYEKEIIEKQFPNIPEAIKPAAEVFLGVITDPAMLAFPFMKSIKAGLKAGAITGKESGPFTNAVKEFVSIGPTRDVESDRLTKLAVKADGGDKLAAQELITEVVGEDVVRKQITETLGDDNKPLFEAVEDTSAKKIVDIGEKKPLMNSAGEQIADTAKPVVEGIEQGKTLPKYAININLSRVDSTDDIKTVIDETAKLYGESITKETRGVQTNEATKALAEAMDMHPDELLSRQRGQAVNAETALAARQILVSSAERLSELSAKVLQPNAGKLDQVAFRKQLALHKAIQEQVSGLTAEAGRTLQQFRIPSVAADVSKELETITKDVTRWNDLLTCLIK